MDWQDYLFWYGIGAFAWAFIMALLGEKNDNDFLKAMVIWPVCAVSTLGQFVRVLFGYRPFS